MEDNVVIAWQDTAGTFLKGDTYRHPKELWQAGYRFDHQRKHWVARPGCDVLAIARINMKPKRGLVFRWKGNRCWVSGDTHPFCVTLKQWGGQWKPTVRHWYFPEQHQESPLRGFEQELSRANRVGELCVVEVLERSEKYKQYLETNANEIAGVVKQLVQRTGAMFWWPVTEENPNCKVCGFHAIWGWYCKNGKSVEKTVACRMPYICPGCRTDWTKIN